MLELIVALLSFICSVKACKKAEQTTKKLYYNYPIPWDEIKEKYDEWEIALFSLVISSLELIITICEIIL